MESAAHIAAVSRGGRTVFTTLRSSPPVALREGVDGLYVVGSAAGPLGGDVSRMDIDVGPGADVTVRGVAASIVLPGPRGERSRATVDATVGAEGSLRWLPEPTVVTAGADHEVHVGLSLEAGARGVWCEHVVLGRHGEAPGSWRSRMRVDLAGVPLLRSDLALGPTHPEWSTSAVLGGHRAVATCLVVGEDRPAAGHWADGEVRVSVAELAGPACVVTGVSRAGSGALSAAIDRALGGAVPVAG